MTVTLTCLRSICFQVRHDSIHCNVAKERSVDLRGESVESVNVKP